MKLIYVIFVCIISIAFIGLITSIASAGLFGPDPTPVPVGTDQWEAVDKCWVYNPCGNGPCADGTIKYFVIYRNQNGHHKIEQVDIDTWYNVNIMVLSGDFDMYYQGG